jgi:hypothetical protein
VDSRSEIETTGSERSRLLRKGFKKYSLLVVVTVDIGKVERRLKTKWMAWMTALPVLENWALAK